MIFIFANVFFFLRWTLETYFYHQTSKTFTYNNFTAKLNNFVAAAIFFLISSILF